MRVTAIAPARAQALSLAEGEGAKEYEAAWPPIHLWISTP